MHYGYVSEFFAVCPGLPQTSWAISSFVYSFVEGELECLHDMVDHQAW